MTAPASISSASDLRVTLPPLQTALLLLDFDGTLIELADHPDSIVVPDVLHNRLCRLLDATDGATAIVTGRELKAIDTFLKGFEGPVFASHGAERRDADGVAIANLAEGFEEIALRLERWCDATPGTVFEKKPVSIAIHFRCCPEQEDDVLAKCLDAANKLKDYTVEAAKMAFEIKPNYVSKAIAVDELSARFPARLIVCFGDDATDEAMFEAAAHKGGFAVKVGDGKTCADHRLTGPDAVARLLDAWLEGHVS